MPARSESAPAKVNLFLHVGRRRADGYHELTSLVVFPDVGDEISVAPAGGLSFAMKGPYAAALREEEGQGLAPLAPAGRAPQHAGRRIENGKSSPARAGEVPERSEGEGGKPRGGALSAFPPPASPHSPQHAGGRMDRDIFGPPVNSVLDAAVTLKGHMFLRGRQTPGAKIVLTKNLPIASGIGGGSADAAATLRILNKMWRLRLSKDDLRGLGLKIGSDVPVCIDLRPHWMEGRGERLERGPRLPEFYMALVNPGVPVPTAAVFKALTDKSGARRPPAPKSFASARSLAAWLTEKTRNDLQPPAIQIAPPVVEVLARLGAQEGCLLARMSGSGATCFGMFETARAAKRAAAAMPRDWWAKAAACG